MRTWMLTTLLLAWVAPLVVCQEANDDKPEKKEETVDELLKRVEDAHKEHKDFKGSFDQTKFLALFGDEIKSNGTFVFKKPDHVRWEYTKPHKSILVVTGESGKKWSEGTGRVESFKLGDDRGLDAVVKQLFTWFKGEFTKLKDDYKVEIKSSEPVTLKMTPKKEVVKKFIASIEVTFSKGEDEIKSVKIIEPAEEGDDPDYTLYTFKDTKLDSDVKDEEFKINK
ncbi:MAG: outer membrane lipoprotein carrier protein LolA [Planctomycetes bacterium]|nr:outer membrane lipoprotein carrier protein LolA [Planctomycetota bacterium]